MERVGVYVLLDPWYLVSKARLLPRTPVTVGTKRPMPCRRWYGIGLAATLIHGYPCRQAGRGSDEPWCLWCQRQQLAIITRVTMARRDQGQDGA